MRYKRIFLSQMQAKVAQRIMSEKLEKLRKTLSRGDYQKWVDEHEPVSPSSVSEDKALNECAPVGYSMVSRERAGLHGGDVVYLFELVPL